MSPNTNPGFGRSVLTVAQAAKYLNVTERWVKRARSEHRLPYIKLGRLVRFDIADLDAYLAANRFEARR